MKKETINLSSGLNLPFSSAVKAGDYIFISGQVGHIDEKGNELSGVEAQTHQCLKSIKKILAKSGCSLSDVVKVTIFLENRNDFGKMNEVYKGYFPHDPPARSTAIAGLAIPRMLVEIDCIAYKPES